MTRRKKDEIRRTKMRLQTERFAWKRANLDEAAIKDFLNIKASGDRAKICEGRVVLRFQKAQTKHTQWLVRRAIKEKQVADKLRTKMSLREKIIEGRKKAVEVVKPKRRNFFQRIFALGKRGT